MIRTLLVVCLALAGVLASNAHYAHKSHRAAAETVLRDYAAVAAEAFVERLASEIGYYGYYTLWIENGFPPMCRPIGTDDFECD